MADGINLTALAAPSSLLAPVDTSGAILRALTMQGTPHSKKLLSGALTADTYLELVSLSTPGWLRVAGVFRFDATSRSVGLKIVIDGTTVLDAADGAAGLLNGGWYGVGGGVTGATLAIEAIRFNSSLSLQIKSSITETDKIALSYSVATV